MMTVVNCTYVFIVLDTGINERISNEGVFALKAFTETY